MNTFFNVVIPTRERADTLVHALNTVTSQNYDALQIVVSDNCSLDHTKEVVHSSGDKRVRYINTNSRLSMSHNWEFALDHLERGWVLFIGDDDGLLPGALETLDRQIREHQVDAVVSRYSLYKWPGHFPEVPEGELLIPLTRKSEVLESATELRRVLGGSQSYKKLPWLYTGGAASLKLVNQSRHPNGTFFCSQCPDIYSAITLARMTRRYLSIGQPISIHGASKHSIGYSYQAERGSPQNAPARQYSSEENIAFHPSLVLGKSIHIVVYESYLQSSHLDADDLDLSLEEILTTAVDAAPWNQRSTVLDQCRAIAQRNGLRLDTKRSPQRFLKSLPSASRAIDSFWLARIDPAEFAIGDVYAASLACAEVYARFMARPTLTRAALVPKFIGNALSKLSPPKG